MSNRREFRAYAALLGLASCLALAAAQGFASPAQRRAGAARPDAVLAVADQLPLGR